jgi:basic amino acid/polyamine antiporter, APA family
MSRNESIEPSLSAFDTAMVVVSLVVGIGIFRTPSIVARETGSSSLFFVAWIVGGAVSLIGALTFAEIGSRRPRAGGYYRVVADSYHPALAFMLNWAQALMQGAGAAGVAFIGAEYLVPVVLPRAWQDGSSTLATACGLMLVLLGLNFLGIRSGARAQNLLSILKIAMIVGLGAVALASRSIHPSGAIVVRPVGLLGALVPVFYALGGYQMTMNLGADVGDARRRFPIAVTVGMVIVVALYLFINFAYVRALGIEGMTGASLVAAALARASLGATGEAIVSVAIFLSAAGFVNATILQMPRTFYAMAEDGVLPRAFLRVNPRTQCQQVGLLLFGVTMLAPAFLLGSFEKLLNYVMFSDSLTLVAVASTIFVLRRHAPDEESDVFRMPGFPLLPGLYLVAMLGISLHVLVFQPRLAGVGTLLFFTGLPLFLLGRRLSRA